jgi:hypothetical protein
VDGGLNLSGFDGAPTRVVDELGLATAGDPHGNRRGRVDISSEGVVEGTGVTRGMLGPKPVQRLYEHNPKHRDQAYRDSSGRIVSRKPVGDCQSMLDSSEQIKPTSPAREGIEPSTGRPVTFRRHHVQETPDEITEFYHGFVDE